MYECVCLFVFVPIAFGFGEEGFMDSGILMLMAQSVADIAPYGCVVAVSGCKDASGHTNSSS